MRVEVYVNLHRQSLSVRALEGPNKGHVIDHPHEVAIRNAEFVVQPAGRDRVRREHKKNVHAFVRGTLIPTREAATLSQRLWPEHYKHFSYNPYRDSGFTDSDSGCELHEALLVRLFKTPKLGYGLWKGETDVRN